MCAIFLSTIQSLKIHSLSAEVALGDRDDVLVGQVEDGPEGQVARSHAGLAVWSRTLSGVSQQSTFRPHSNYSSSGSNGGTTTFKIVIRPTARCRTPAGI